MTTFVIKKSSLSGSIRIPGSKSQTLRAILFAALANGKSTIHAYLDAADTHSMIMAVRLMGAVVQIHPDHLEIIGTAGKIGPFEDVVQAGNSGIILRFMTALAAISNHPFVITGDPSIRHQRPMHTLNKALRDLGGSVTSLRGDNFAPLIVQGPLLHGEITLDGTDSQPVSALLIASAFKTTSTKITVTDPGEIPWVEMTLEWLARLGTAVSHTDYKTYYIQGSAAYQGFTYTVPGDLSTSAFPLAAALITQSSLTVENIDLNDSQGDKEFIFTLQKMGADIQIDPASKTLNVLPGSSLKGIEINVNAFIDAVPILAALSCYAAGKTLITGASGARTKECNRLACTALELKKMGANIQETAEGLLIHPAKLSPATLFSHHDHRLCMALSVAAMGVEGQSSVTDSDCVRKTYPDFLQEFQKLGAAIYD